MVPLESHARLRWLSRLRWLALFGVSLATVAGRAGLVPGINLPAMIGAVVLGIGADTWVRWRSRRRGDTDDRHLGQALLDTAVLTLVIWAAGGSECPFLPFYMFPVLLAALLGGPGAVWPTGAASAFGLAFQVAAVYVPGLRIGRWNPSTPFDQILETVAVMITVAMAAYFAVRFTDALRHQMRARRELDTILRVAIDHLGAGVEIVDNGHVTWQNPLAERLFGRRTEQRWRWPDRTADAAEPGDATDPRPATDPPTAQLEAEDRPLPTEATRQEFTLPAEDGPERIYELHVFPLPESRRFLALSLDRTRAVLDQRRLMLTERLASLGRTVQGVAHELNTPLATIQTLGRDVVDVVDTAGLPDAVRTDLAESANMIVAEVQRCRRITHALLGRVDRFDARDGAEASLVEAIERAAAVVFTSARHRVSLHFEPGTERARRPLDPVVQIFVNLLQNARDAAPEDAVTLRAELRSAGLESGLPVAEAVRIQVRDQGPGLTEGALKHLFEPFFTTKPPGRGTGLGLYTSYGLARSLGAELSLDNHPEGGAVATLLVPIDPPPVPVGGLAALPDPSPTGPSTPADAAAQRP